MIDILTGSSGFLGKHLMQKIGAGAIAVPHQAIHETHFPDCDRFFFLSTYGNIFGQDDVQEIIRANIGNLGYVLGTYIEESKCQSFVFVSSSSVSLPVQTPYSHAKRAAEEMVLASGIPACIIRPFSITGVGEQKSHLIPTLIRSCLDDEHMTLNPAPTHDWVDVQDVVDGMLALADNKARGIFEFGNGNGWTNEDVLNLVEQITRKRANVTLTEKQVRPYDSTEWVCKDFRAREFGWAPKKSLGRSIIEMVNAHKFQR